MKSLKTVIEKQLQSKAVKHGFIPLPKDMEKNPQNKMSCLNISARDVISTLVYWADGNLIALQKRADTKVDEDKVKKLLSLRTLRFATKDELAEIGTEIGSVPPTGLEIPHIMDVALLSQEYVYGGGGDQNYVLKIGVNDLKVINDAGVLSFSM